MVKLRQNESKGGRVASGLSGVLAALALLGACNGDTLYEAVSGAAGPDVAITRPGKGAEVVAGRPIPVRIEASDTLGVARIDLTWTGVGSGVYRFDFVPPRRSVVLDTVIVLGTTNTGRLQLQAVSRNGLGAVGQADPVSINVTRGDTIIPAVAVTVQAPPRVELTDTIRVRVSARDNDGGSGLVALGFTALIVASTGPDTLIFERSASLPSPATGQVTREFAFAPPFADARTLPTVLRLEVHAWAADESGNCAAAVSGAEQRLACATFRNRTIAAATPSPITTTVVAGRSIALGAGSVIADAVPDVSRERLYLSNLGRNRIDVLDLRTRLFGTPVAVGSQPWGVALNRTRDTLLVANSGGTSVSSVPLAGTPVEAVSRRIHTPNAVLFTVERQFDTNGRERLQVRFFDFSDRPQFLAQDAAGRLLYSTLPTAAAPDGTIRLAENEPGWEQPEVRILVGRGIYEADSTNVSILNVDSMRVFSTTTGSDQIVIYDHKRGFPSQIVSSGLLPLDSAIAVLDANPDSDIVWAPGRYVLDLVGLSDTTYVAASADHEKIAFGEGAHSAGRVILWRSAASSISNEITVADLVGNTSEHIVGLALNGDGSLGAARGLRAAYYFKDDLRLQGHFAAPVPGAGSGAVVHPQHPSYATYPPSGPTTLSFVAAGTSVRIVDTVHFAERGAIAVRDDIVGPLRVSLPLPSDNASCSGGDCIVAKLYGVTNAGAVVVVDVRGRDIK
jgi:hypothetical protein